jgi:hypothetical protein
MIHAIWCFMQQGHMRWQHDQTRPQGVLWQRKPPAAVTCHWTADTRTAAYKRAAASSQPPAGRSHKLGRLPACAQQVRDLLLLVLLLLLLLPKS